jgi:hypothetical protein
MQASGNSRAPPTIKRLANIFAADCAAKQAITRYAIAISSDSVRDEIQSGITLRSKFRKEVSLRNIFRSSEAKPLTAALMHIVPEGLGL